MLGHLNKLTLIEFLQEVSAKIMGALFHDFSEGIVGHFPDPDLPLLVFLLDLLDFGKNNLEPIEVDFEIPAD